MELVRIELPILSAYIVAIDTYGTAIFTNRTDGLGLEFPGGCPEPYDKTWQDTACREFQEEVEPKHWSLNDLHLIGECTVASQKRFGMYGLVLYLSEIPFIDSIDVEGFRTVDGDKKDEEVDGIFLASWNLLPTRILPFQLGSFIPQVDEMLGTYLRAYLSHDVRPHVSFEGMCVIWNGITSRSLEYNRG